MKLKSRRLVLEPFQKHEVELFISINTNKEVRKYLWDDMKISKIQAQEILTLNEAHFAGKGYGLWKIIPTNAGEVVGYAGLWFFFEEPQPQLIYAILPDHQRKGYAVEAGLAVMQYAFHQLGFSYLIASMDEQHRASRAVAERLGMHQHKSEIIDQKPTVFYKILFGTSKVNLL